MRKYLLRIVLIILSIAQNVYAQNISAPEIDSLNRKLYFLSQEPGAKSFDSLFNKVIFLSGKIGYKAGVAEAYYNLGINENVNGKPDEALAHLQESMRRYEKIEHGGGLTDCYQAVAGLYKSRGMLKEALDFELKSIAVEEKTNVPKRLAWVYNNVANTYQFMHDYKNSVVYYLKSKSIYEEIKDTSKLSIVLSNLGDVYDLMGNQDEAYNSLTKSAELAAKSKNDYQLASAYINIASIHLKNNRLAEAEALLLDALKIGKDLNDINLQYYGYGLYATVLGRTKRFEKALEYKQLEYQFKDTLFEMNKEENIQKLKVTYDTERKEKENEILTQKVQLEHAEAVQHKTMFYFSIPLVLIFIFAAIILFRQNKTKQKVNRVLNQKNIIIEEKNKLVEEKSKLVEEQNKDITDSIRYAKRIQDAILPPDRMWYTILPDSFVLFRPKDILSGDFYWVEETESHIYFAAADCTGHGVPGALMSVVNFSLLNKAVLERSLVSPAEILNAVNDWLTVALHQTFNESSVKDGMDISLCSINKKTNEFTFAGANNPLYILSNNNEIKIVPGDSFPVGAFIEEKKTSFTNHSFPVNGDEIVYIFSDGYADQFGGPKGKKFKYRQLQEKLKALQNVTLQKQKHELFKTFEDWKGYLEQVDDVLVIGVKLYKV